MVEMTVASSVVWLVVVMAAQSVDETAAHWDAKSAAWKVVLWAGPLVAASVERTAVVLGI